jgi:kumamolisin
VDLAQMDDLTIHVRSLGRTEELEKRVQDESRKPLAERKYLSREELASTQGASAADLDLVEQFAHNHNLVIAHRSAAERSIVLKGTVGDLLKAFPADVSLYHHSSGTYRGRRGEIKIPEELEGIVTGVFGWDTRTRHRCSRAPKALAAGGPGNGNGVSAAVFAKQYNFPTNFQGTKLDGTGQTIAIIELGGGYRTSDLKVFFQEIGTPMPVVSAVSVDHAGNNPSTFQSDDGEVMLDIEVAGAVAPKARYVVYFAPNDGDQGFSDAISAAIHDTQRKPSVISISWGGPESTSDQQGIKMFHDLFTQAAAAGITVCAAAGDHGTADLDAEHNWMRPIRTLYGTTARPSM